ncbi:Transmembrane protein C18orf45 [Apostichopus japonicus]|uniref:Transmembrane protein C18orf45 n=1 Tax=Stichopus japonicus TaxID=307972 RepID=A0A2G8KBG5_STIJA|nr:Transmembrane protein C18orf45 [Apostichopus japonicus]
MKQTTFGKAPFLDCLTKNSVLYTYISLQVNCSVYPYLNITVGYCTCAADFPRREILKWCHGVFFFIISIFSGSKALSILPIPAFIALQNTVDVLVYVFQTTQTKRLGNAAVVISAIMVLVAAYSLANSGEQNLSSGYSWMMTHIVSTVLLILSQKWLKPASFSDVDCLLYQYLISVVIFTPGSFLLGDLTDAFYFTNWYSMKFYVGCILSGLLGVLLNLTVIHMKGTDADVMPVALALSKSILIVLSQHLFETSLTSDFRFCLLVNMTSYYVFLWLHPLVEGAGGGEETVQKLSKEVV